jgi:5-methyltetrahydrofolate--homocysteine methyltransferase
MATQLQQAGLPVGEPGDLWCLSHPERVRAVHDAYRDAGCDILTTNSFGANRWTFDRRGITVAVEDVNLAAAKIAVSAATGGQVVLGDVGPSGLLVEPLGSLTLGQCRSEYGRQVRALLSGGADGVVIETMSELQEAVAAVEAAREAGAVAIVACMSFSRLPTGRLRTLQGVGPEEAAEALVKAGATVVGANCGTRMGFEDVADLVRQIASAGGVPVAAIPNAGPPRMVGTLARYEMDPETFAQGMQVVIEAGAALVGGCCGTTPAHLAALRRVVGAGAAS